MELLFTGNEEYDLKVYLFKAHYDVSKPWYNLLKSDNIVFEGTLDKFLNEDSTTEGEVAIIKPEYFLLSYPNDEVIVRKIYRDHGIHRVQCEFKYSSKAAWLDSYKVQKKNSFFRIFNKSFEMDQYNTDYEYYNKDPYSLFSFVVKNTIEKEGLAYESFKENGYIIIEKISKDYVHNLKK